MPGTSVRYTGHARSSVEIARDGRVIGSMGLQQFCDLDGDLRDTAALAMAQPGVWVAVPTQTAARGVRVRNYGKMGVAL